DAVSGLGDAAMSLLPADFSRERLVLALGIEGGALRLAMANPLDYRTLQDVEFRSGKRVVAVVASETALRSKLERAVTGSAGDDTFDLFQEMTPAGEVEWEAPSDADPGRGGALPPVIRVVNMILSDAARVGASDVHVEPQENHLLVRRRIDGLLEDVMRIQRDMQNAIISRLKIIASMDIAERRKPQDGRSTLRLGDRRIDLRLSSLPTQFGEKIVVRLLDTDRRQLDLAKLIGSPDCLQKLRELLSRPQGMLLVAAPTGSGKTTTLYAALSWLRSSTKNIITVEDPIEYQLAGINQVQINQRAGVTFASGLRSILRQDPNIVLVGEIRDQETANIALEAAQTGHLLLSTVHANDAASTITRLFDLGVEPFLIASSLVGVLAQRLVRRPCTACAKPVSPAAEDVERIGGAARLPAGAAWKAGAGCKACGDSGFRGRLAVHELMYVTEELRELISRRASEDELREAAKRAGMRTLMEDGIAKAAQGATTLDELSRHRRDRAGGSHDRAGRSRGGRRRREAGHAADGAGEREGARGRGQCDHRHRRQVLPGARRLHGDGGRRRQPGSRAGVSGAARRGRHRPQHARNGRHRARAGAARRSQDRARGDLDVDLGHEPGARGRGPCRGRRRLHEQAGRAAPTRRARAVARQARGAADVPGLGRGKEALAVLPGDRFGDLARELAEPALDVAMVVADDLPPRRGPGVGAHHEADSGSSVPPGATSVRSASSTQSFG
ncbi:MAG: hypothetical protein DME05_08710, partial [Candidatus Rokuibacteriota bacterium]